MSPRRLQRHSPRGCLGLLLLLALPGAAQGSSQVHVSPEAPMVEHGGSVWINCSHTCDDPAAPGGLETSLTKTATERGPGWAAFLLRDIDQWASTLQCFFTCRGNLTKASATLSAYRAPERVVLEPLPAMELGRAYNLTCRVLDVAPVRHLSVTLLRGGRALHTETFRTHPRNEPDSVTVTHEITPGRWDHGQQVTCQAGLDLAPRGPLLQSNSSEVELREAESPPARLIALAAVASLAGELLAVLACGLVQRGRSRRGAAPRRAGLELAPAKGEPGPADASPESSWRRVQRRDAGDGA